MDDKTQKTLNEFSIYLAKYITSRKALNSASVGKFSLHGDRVCFEIFIHQQPQKIYFDLREIKENEGRFSHLLENGMDQLTVYKS